MPSRAIDTTVHINAGPDAVWDVLTDFASYQERNPGTHIEGAPEVGTKLAVHMTGGMSFKPKVLAATPGKELRWLGKLSARPSNNASSSSTELERQLALKDKIAETHFRRGHPV